MWAGIDAEIRRRQARLLSLVHLPISLFELSGIKRGVEQRCSQAIGAQAGPDGGHALRIIRQGDGQRFVLILAGRHQLGQSDGRQQAGGYRDWNDSPRRVSTGRPAHNASLAVV